MKDKQDNSFLVFPETDEKQRVYTVSELTREIRSLLEEEFGFVIVEGEVSNMRQPSSGHCYFTIKDESSQIKVALFRSAYEVQKIKPMDGMLIRVHGELTVYEKNGEYQIIARKIEEAGKGSLYARLEALKEKLKKEGLFDESRKKPLPLLPLHIGIVTSPRGAAIRDMLKILARRFPNLHVIIVPVKVQGEGAAEEIAAAIDLLNERNEVDVIITGRGGGSIEDLWAFNEEIVARAVARSQIPVISAVGHEIDFTICDFVADVRAPTPSAAAEIVIGRKEEFETLLTNFASSIKKSLFSSLSEAKNQLRSIIGHYVFKQPANVVYSYREKVNAVLMRMRHVLETRFREYVQRTDEFAYHLNMRMEMVIKEKKQDIKRMESHLRALNPLSILGRGYSLTRNKEGKIIKSASEVSEGERITTLLGKGIVESDVVKIRANEM